MAYVDHAFSISDEDIMMADSSRTIENRPPIKEIAFAVSLLVFGSLAIVVGSIMAANRIGGDRAHGDYLLSLRILIFYLVGFLPDPPFTPFLGWIWMVGLGVFFAILGSVLFLPGFYYTRIAYYAYKGYKGFSFDNIPAV
ncbi:hypothetical protein BHE74_00005132 [Ensete ventricosum]|nr:hypothetical protein GW17_00036828 [Ensete ventricosum]RWW86101.1 hypothetical protein BHE74_00005132 [Ensete ventricosum]RZS03309.1 hypothetical protein BHM03_00033477 [Ensete ventricosum]